MQKQVNINLPYSDKERVLISLAPFFIAWLSLWDYTKYSFPFCAGILSLKHQESVDCFGKELFQGGAACSEIVSCFKMKTDHENLQRNTHY
jgi:hypothetical protein